MAVDGLFAPTLSDIPFVGNNSISEFKNTYRPIERAIEFYYVEAEELHQFI